MDADVIVVGAGLAGLAATAELADAGKRVLLLDQEPEQSLGGQAFWSLGGLFLVDTPEQRRMGVKDSYELALQDWMGSAQFDRETRLLAAPAGPRPTSPSPPARSGSGCTTWACGSSRSSAGPSAATGAPAATATRCRASTSPGAPARAWSRRSSGGCARRSPAGLVTFAFRHRVDDLVVDGRHRRRRPRRAARARRHGARRGVQPRRGRRRSSYAAQAVIVTSGGIGGNHELVRQQLAGRPARAGRRSTWSPACPAHVDGRMHRDHRGRRRRGRSTPTGCGTTPRASATGTRSGPTTASGSSPARRRSGSTATGERFPAPYLPGFDTLGTLRRDHAHRLRLLVVRADPEDHREGVRALGLRAEPRPHRQGRQAAALAAARRAHPARSRRSSSTARTSWSPTTCTDLVAGMNEVAGERR